MYKNFDLTCLNRIENLCILPQIIQLGKFTDIDVHSGFTFYTQMFKVNKCDVEKYLYEPLHPDDQLVVKVFDPFKAKRDHEEDEDDVDEEGESRSEYMGIDEICINYYLSELSNYERLIENPNFNSVYIKQGRLFGQFNIGKHYHAFGLFIIMKYIDPKANVLPINKEVYEKAKLQLDIIHGKGMAHGDINRDKVLYSQEKVYFIDFSGRYICNKEDDRDMLRNLFMI